MNPFQVLILTIRSEDITFFIIALTFLPRAHSGILRISPFYIDELMLGHMITLIFS